MWMEYEKFCAKNGEKIGWDSEVFDPVRELLEEESNFTKNPIQFSEGVPCKKCRSDNTYSYQKQVRSSDEGFSTFTSCFKCKYSWRDN